jgi:hypothetical protein
MITLQHEDDLLGRQEERRKMLDMLIEQTQKGREALDPEKDRQLRKESEQRWRALDNKRCVFGDLWIKNTPVSARLAY